MRQPLSPHRPGGTVRQRDSRVRLQPTLGGAVATLLLPVAFVAGVTLAAWLYEFAVAVPEAVALSAAALLLSLLYAPVRHTVAAVVLPQPDGVRTVG